jgi:GntR family transcriptional regulator, transcriptional repressor for pyruvate dehydrogenase complex
MATTKKPTQLVEPPTVKATSFQAVKSTRAFEEIAAQFRTELAQGRLEVGSRLPSERVLSAQFGVSRNTLREALRSLEHAGLIRLVKGSSGGAFVTENTGAAISSGMFDLFDLGTIGAEEITQARIWLETIVVKEACARATDEDLALLERNIDEAEQAFAAGDFPRRAEKNLEFHRILARIAGNPVMVIFMDALLNVLHQFIKTIGEYSNAYVLPSRRRFMTHMREGNVEGAVSEMELSLQRLQRAYLSRIDPAGDKLPGADASPIAQQQARPAVKQKVTAKKKTSAKIRS